MNRLIKAFWFVTLLGVSAFLLFVYAGFREDQLIFINNTIAGVSRENFFFIALGVIMVANFTLYVLAWRLRKQDHKLAEFTKAWLNGLGISFNFFLLIVLSFLQVFNGGESFNFSNFGYLIYISLAAILICVIIFPVYVIKEKLKS